MRIKSLLRPDKDTFNAVRRTLCQRVDQIYARSSKRLVANNPNIHFESPTRFSLITVNFSTTYYLKLMLLTLCKQENLSNLHRIVIVDNNSQDGGVTFLKKLANITKHVHLIENKIICTHAYGLRKGIAYIDEIDQRSCQQECSNALLICDTDIIFRNPQTLKEIGSLLAEDDTAFAGELRYGLYPYPEAQASFFAIRRDCYARPDIAPIVNHGAPAYFMQRSLWKAGLKLANFPSNKEGYILHRGRSGVAAANRYYRLNAYSTVSNNIPHYMGIEGGDIIWGKIEKEHRHLLEPGGEKYLLEIISERLDGLLWQ